ncbi:MAG: class I SAM-dependent methyltransferase [Flavobacteriales bacterium]|nr:class I SAM-dependent methyltransferase [Flavobacteriales bacterium]
MSKFKLAIDYLQYLIKSKDEHGVHSPFVYNLVTQVLYDRTPFYAFHQLDAVRNQLLADNSQIVVEDFGAGSHKLKSNHRKIKDIAKTSLSSTKFSELYFKLVNRFQANTILELGTSLGLTTSYLAKANSKAKVYTIEGSSSLANYSNNVFKRQKIENIELRIGQFDEVLEPLLTEIQESVDFVFIDGNHQEEATLKYFNLVIEKCHNESIIVFDDIRWSRGMLSAWNRIKADDRVTVSLDLFFVGIVFLRKEQMKENFVLKF